MQKGSDEKAFRRVPFYREFVTMRNSVIILMALLAVVVASYIFFRFPPAAASYAFSGLDWKLYFLIVLLLNGGTGVIVSLLISTIILRDQRFEVQIDLDSKVNDIATNVFAGTLGMRLDRRYVDLAIRHILSPTVVREDMSIAISMLPIDAVAGMPEGRRFVLLRTSASWRARNISSQRVEIPIGVKLPNPMLDPLIDLVTLRRIDIGGGAVAADRIAKLNEAARDLAKRRETAELVMIADPLTLEPDLPITITVEYDIVKEEEDNEIIQTSVPTERMSLKVFDQTGRNLVMMAKAIHSADIEPASRAVTHDGWAEWTLSEWSFPRQGIVVWWKLPVRPALPTIHDEGMRVDEPEGLLQSIRARLGIAKSS